MLISQMTVGLRDQHTAVPMALPGGDGLEVNALLDRACDEAASERARRKMGEIEAFASRIQSLLRVPDFEDWLAIQNAAPVSQIVQEAV